jgi:ankyrin repeat protein
MSGYQNVRLAALALACLVLVLPASTLAGKLTDAIRQRDVALVRTLLEAGGDVQEKVRGDFPLNIASTFGPVEMVAVLLDAGADIERPNRDGLRPLHNAAGIGQRDIVTLLLRKNARTDATDRQGRTPLNHFAANGGSDIEIAKALLAAGADPDSEDMDHWTALNYVARYSGNVELAKILITAGADINHGKDNGETPVGSATFHGHYELAKALIASGADVNKPLKDGTSPLAQTTDAAMRQLLINAGAKE